MAGGFWVHAGGVWRSIDTVSGRVQGWSGRAQFVVLRRGRLQLARAGPVLRGMRALQRGQPTTVLHGSPLMQRRPYVEHRHRARSPVRCHCKQRPPAEPRGPLVQLNLSNQCAGAQAPAADVTTKTEPLRADAAVQAAPSPPRAHKRPRSRSPREPERPAKLPRPASPTPLDTSDEDAPLCKELIVCEEDVAALRGLLARRNVLAADLRRFDDDDGYKARLFYRINPLVCLERCPRIAAMLQQQRETFARSLGLRAVREAASAPRRRTRTIARSSDDTSSDVTSGTRTLPPRGMGHKVDPRPADLGERRRAERASVESDSDTQTHARGRRGAGRARAAQRSPQKRNGVDSQNSKSKRKTIGSSDSDVSEYVWANRPGAGAAPRRRSGRQRAPAAAATSDAISDKPRKNRAVNKENVNSDRGGEGGGGGSAASSRMRGGPRKDRGGTMAAVLNDVNLNSREYSSLEDHVIVQWLALGARARMVNGNRLWRELQTEYSRLAGRERSWHSLRNRYLRGILPALHRLALPARTVAALRAAQARGEIKSRRRSAAPPPLAPPAVRSAWAARPRPRVHDVTAPVDHEPTGQAEEETSDASPSPPPRALRSSTKALSPPPPPPATYSEVTRRFAARHRPSSSSPDVPGAPPPQGSVSPHAKRTRKLFNPKTQM